MEKVRARKRDIVNSFRGGSERRLKDASVEVLMGEGSFLSPNEVKVVMSDGSEKVVKAEKIFINVGERPAPPTCPGWEKIPKERMLDSTSTQELAIVPEHLVVIGSGYVGVEFAQLFRRLGAGVTILRRGRQFLPREDPEIAGEMKKILEEDGLKVFLNSEASAVEASSSDEFTLTVVTKDSPSTAIKGAYLLHTAGRISNTEALNLSACGLEINKRGYIEVNGYP